MRTIDRSYITTIIWWSTFSVIFFNKTYCFKEILTKDTFSKYINLVRYKVRFEVSIFNDVDLVVFLSLCFASVFAESL